MKPDYTCYRCYQTGKYKKDRDEYNRLVCQCGSKTFFSNIKETK